MNQPAPTATPLDDMPANVKKQFWNERRKKKLKRLRHSMRKGVAPRPQPY